MDDGRSPVICEDLEHARGCEALQGPKSQPMASSSGLSKMTKYWAKGSCEMGNTAALDALFSLEKRQFSLHCTINSLHS